MATVNIPEEFIQSGMEGDTVHMKLKGKMAYLMKNIDPKIYKKYVTKKKERMVLYVDLKESLYVTLQATLIFWRNLTLSLQW